MRVVISQPMNGLTDQQIMEKRMVVIRQLDAVGIQVIDTIFDGSKLDDRDYYHPALYYLGASIDAIGRADAVFFMEGWEEARGCVIEHTICEKYDIPILDSIPEKIEEEIIAEDVQEPVEEIKEDN